MAEDGRAKQEWLSTFLSLPNGIPSTDTFAQVFARLDPEQRQSCFVSWVNAISQLLGAEMVGIDGRNRWQDTASFLRQKCRQSGNP